MKKMWLWKCLVVTGLAIVLAHSPVWANGMPDTEESFDWMLEGAVEDPVGLVVNILQLTTYDRDDTYQCWPMNPWSSDGSKIVYQSDREMGDVLKIDGPIEDPEEICVINADGTGFDRLTYNDRCDSHPSFVWPDNQKIVFQRNVTDTIMMDPPVKGLVEVDVNHGSIWIMDADGSNQTNLTDAHGGPVRGDGTCENKPVVSPNGQKIAFRGCTNIRYEDRKGGNDETNLYVMNIDGSSPVLIAEYTEYEDISHHSWSPDSQWLVFQAEEAEGVGDARIFKAKADGSQVLRLSPDLNDIPADWNGGYCQAWPAWSPDGKWISCYVNTDEPQDQSKNGVYDDRLIVIMDTNGGNMKTIAEYDPQDIYTKVHSQSTWSPDSRWLSYRMTDNNNNYVICMSNIYDGRFQQLTTDYREYRHWWSPDPKKGAGKILFKDEGNTESRDFDAPQGWEDEYDDILVLNLAPWALDKIKGSGRKTFENCGQVTWEDAGMKLKTVLGGGMGNPMFIGALYAGDPASSDFGGTFWDLYCPNPDNVLTATVGLYFNGYNSDMRFVWNNPDRGWLLLNPDMYQVGHGKYPVGPVSYTSVLTVTISADTEPGLDDLTGTVFAAQNPEEDPSPIQKGNSNFIMCFVNTAGHNSHDAMPYGILITALALCLGVFCRRRFNA